MLKDIVSPTIKAHLLVLATHLKNVGYGVVIDLGIRLTTWINGNDRGQFILDHYTNMGFYYIQIINITTSNDLKPTIHFQLKNLFTDEVVLGAGFARFKQLQSGGALEMENYTELGFQQFQSASGLSKFSDWAKPGKIIFARSATQFTETITPGTGGGGIVEGGNIGGGGGGATYGGSTTPPAGTSPSSAFMDYLKANPLISALGAGALIYALYKMTE